MRASASEAAATRAELMAAIEDVRRLAPLGDSIGVGKVSFDLVTTAADRWCWQLLDKASVLEHESVTFELHTAADEWAWQLVDAYGETMLESTRTHATRTDAREAMAVLKA